MPVNKFYIAAAGSGKTTLIVNEALSCENDRRVLIVTYTNANAQSIIDKFVQINNGYKPTNITVQTWFSFLLEHGVRPYRFWDRRAEGMQLVNQASALYIPEIRNGNLVISHFFNSNMDVYSDKLSKLFFRCNEKSDGYVVKRLERVYHHVYIDEVQDMAGWDLEIIKLFLRSNMVLTMVGDPRQTVYHTHNEKKHNQYMDGKIREFILSHCGDTCVIEESILKDSYRNSASICALSSKLYPEFKECRSLLKLTHRHMGIFFVKECDVRTYAAQIVPLQLKYDNNRKMLLTTQSMTFGTSKGLEAEHVLIYPTQDMLKWLNGGQCTLTFSTKAKLYVALTRAFFSVGIVVPNNFKSKTQEIGIWESTYT